MGKAWQVRTWVEVHIGSAGLLAPMDPVGATTAEAPSTLGEVERRRGGEEARRGGEVARVVSNLRVGPDSHRGWAINISRGGAGQKETLANHWRQGSQEGVSEGWVVEEVPEVLARDSSSL